MVSLGSLGWMVGVLKVLRMVGVLRVLRVDGWMDGWYRVVNVPRVFRLGV